MLCAPANHMEFGADYRRASARASDGRTDERCRLHDARHTYGTLLHLQGVPIAVISAWLGHSDNAFTMRTYVHSQNHALLGAADTLQALVRRRDEPSDDAR